MATCLCHQNGRMECWNAGILGVRVEITHSNCKQLLQTHHFYPACPAVPCESCNSKSEAHFTGVSPKDRTGLKLFSISPGPLFQLGRTPLVLMEMMLLYSIKISCKNEGRCFTYSQIHQPQIKEGFHKRKPGHSYHITNKQSRHQ